MSETSPAKNTPTTGRRYRIAPASASWLEWLASLAMDPGRQIIPLGVKDAGAVQIALQQLAADGCLLAAVTGTRIVASAGLDIDRARLSHLQFEVTGDPAGPEPGFRPAGDPDPVSLPRRLVAAVERLAVRFGIPALNIECAASQAPLFLSLGYRYSDSPGPQTSATGDHCTVRLQRSVLARQTAYSRRIRAIGTALGIPADYALAHRLGLQNEAQQLRSIGTDIYGREQRMAPRAARAWQRMRECAAAEGVALEAVSAFRSVCYQQALVVRKLERGQSIGRVLEVSAAPGYSEHHTGKAIDVTTPGFDVLEEVFDNSPAFDWLQRHAPGHGFRLSFPRNNRHHVCYEPWHWYFTG